MQRFGFLKHLIWRASLSATSDISRLGKDLTAAATQKVTTKVTPSLQEYVKCALTESTYRNLRSVVLSADDSDTAQMEVQDILLSDSRLPSRRGKLNADDWNRYPHLAVVLGFLREGTYSMLVRGQSFLSFVTDEEKKALLSTSVLPSSKFPTPFLFSLEQKLLLMFSLIEADGRVLKELYRRILVSSATFTDREAGDLLPEVYRIIAEELKEKARIGSDFLAIQKLSESADRIQAVKIRSNPGGKNPRENAIAIRLEPFVDWGILRKPDPFSYRYELSDSTQIFFGNLTQVSDVEEFLSNHFFLTSIKTLGINGQHSSEPEHLVAGLQKAYSNLKSPLGYAPILELCVFAGISSLTDSGRYFEISEAKDFLKALQKEMPYLVRFNVNRMGELSFVKFTDDIMACLAKG